MKSKPPSAHAPRYSGPFRAPQLGYNSAGVEPLNNSAPPPQCDLRTVDLFSNRDEVRIEHLGEIYKLHLTAKGKLILDK